MEGRLGKIATFSFAAALVLEGCSNVSTPSSKKSPEAPTPTPTSNIKIDYLVDCKNGPFDEPSKIYDLNTNENIRIGAKLSDGKKDVIRLYPTGDGGFDYFPEDNDFVKVKDVPGQVVLQDKNISVVIVAGLNGSKTMIGTSITCADYLPEVKPQA